MACHAQLFGAWGAGSGASRAQGHRRSVSSTPRTRASHAGRGRRRGDRRSEVHDSSSDRMTQDGFEAIVRRPQGGVLLDTNVLLLHLMDLTDAAAVAGWKQTLQFTDAHLVYLRAAVAHARRIVTTPHIVAEAT